MMIWKKAIIVFSSLLFTISLFGQRRWTKEQVDSLALEYPRAIYCFGEYREISYDIDEDGYVRTVRFETEHKSKKFARQDFKRSLEYFRDSELEEWKISNTEFVIYLDEYFVYLMRNKEYIEIEFCRNPGK